MDIYVYLHLNMCTSTRLAVCRQPQGTCVFPQVLADDLWCWMNHSWWEKVHRGYQQALASQGAFPGSWLVNIYFYSVYLQIWNILKDTQEVANTKFPQEGVARSRKINGEVGVVCGVPACLRACVCTCLWVHINRHTLWGFVCLFICVLSDRTMTQDPKGIGD